MVQLVVFLMVLHHNVAYIHRNKVIFQEICQAFPPYSYIFGMYAGSRKYPHRSVRILLLLQ